MFSTSRNANASVSPLAPAISQLCFHAESTSIPKKNPFG
jgi:hypothetical protein